MTPPTPAEIRQAAEKLRDSEGYIDLDRFDSVDLWVEAVVEPVLVAFGIKP